MYRSVDQVEEIFLPIPLVEHADCLRLDCEKHETSTPRENAYVEAVHTCDAALALDFEFIENLLVLAIASARDSAGQLSGEVK